ncbi:MAG: DNA polymerase III subunit beta [Candidatus Daviesbacteria bacterium]|nr:DNA polymerase III subunit beta [Candidatus Daviesbacteria bacterium]
MFLPGKKNKLKFTVLQQDFLPALTAVARSSGAHTQLPVLENILLATEGTKLKIAATNLEIGVIKYLSVEVLEAGELTIPAKTIVELISGLKPAKVTFESSGESLVISVDKFKATINGISAAEFPVIPVSGSEGVVFKKETLQQSGQILFAAAVDEGRPTLTGILTQTSGDKLDFVATDGFRLAHRQVTLETAETKFKSIIPRRTFEEILRIIGEEETDEIKIAIAENQNQIIFDFGSTVVSSRLIEGSFPAWEKIIPTQIVARAMVDKEELLKAIKLAAVFAKSEANVVILKTSAGKITLESSAKELGSQQNEIEGEVSGEELQVAFNTKFLQDAVGASSTSQLTIEFSGPLSPTLIKPIGVEGLQYIVMPVRLN